MKKSSLSLLLVLAPFASAEEGIMDVAAANRFNLAAQFRTVVEPTSDGLGLKAWGGGVRVTNDGVFHRFILDRLQKVYVGYDVRLAEGPDATMVELTIEPLSLDPKELPLEDASSWKSFPIVREPKTQVLKLLDSVALDLLVRHPTGQTVVDYITVSRDLERLNRQRRGRGEPRPYKAEDTEMELDRPSILINGKPVLETNGTLRITGATIGLYMRDRGRFLFSLFPNESLGFRQLGWVHRSVLHFELGGDKVEIESRRRIVPGAATYDIYVLHEPGFQPEGGLAQQDVYFFAAGPPASLLQDERR